MRRLLNTLYILDETAWLTLDGENIVCRCKDKEKFRMPLYNIEEIICFSYVGCSPALMGKCADRGISVAFISPQGEFLATLNGKCKGNILLRKAQFELFSDPPAKLKQNTIVAKLTNTRSLIKRSLRDRPEIDNDGAIADCISVLDNGIRQICEFGDSDSLMWIEGVCAKAYFGMFGRLITIHDEAFSVNGRSKRPPLDRVNSMLSFLYTLLTESYISALESVGLDSCYGFYHELRSGRSSLACDLVEETRCIVERLVLTMINTKQIKAEDFEQKEDGAVWLNDAGRRKVITAWQEKKRSLITHPYLNEKIPLGLLPYAQSTLLAKYIRGDIDEYPCYLHK